MSMNIRIAILIVAFILSLVIISALKNGKVPVKYSLFWWIAVVLLLLLSIFPNIFIGITKLLGFQTISNMVVGVFVIILLFVTISLTIIISGQSKKIALLIQEISILKGEINRK